MFFYHIIRAAALAGLALAPTAAMANTFATLFSFNCGGTYGCDLEYPLIAHGGKLYGTTLFGTVFSLTTGGSPSLLHSLSANTEGGKPSQPTVQGHFLYGTTEGGNSTGSGGGVVYKINLNNNNSFSLVYTFSTNAGDGRASVAPVSYYNGPNHPAGLLYGTTRNGGSGSGTVYAVDPNTNTETFVYPFTGGADGLDPEVGLTYDGTNFWGVTQYGGANSDGEIFKVDTSTNTVTPYYSFNNTGGFNDGAQPLTRMIYRNGTLFGTTSAKGVNSAGTLFSISTTTPTLVVLHPFAGGTDGSGPAGDLAFRGNGNTTKIYGTTIGGGANSTGMAFRYKLSSSAYADIYDFPANAGGASGLVSLGPLLYGVDDRLGVAYSLTP